MPVTLTPGFAAGAPVKLIDNSRYTGAGRQGQGRAYDVASDDSRFLMLVNSPRRGDGELPLVVVQNWFTELERLVPRRPAR